MWARTPRWRHPGLYGGHTLDGMAPQSSAPSAAHRGRRDNWFTRTLLSFLGPADSQPMGPEMDVSGHHARLCPLCEHPFSEHSYDRTDDDSRIYCPVD